MSVVQRAKVEVREDEGEKEERGRAREQMRGRVQIPAHQLRRLALDDAVLGCGLRDAAHDEPPAGDAAGRPAGREGSP
jgi:hypothetical protein